MRQPVKPSPSSARFGSPPVLPSDASSKTDGEAADSEQGPTRILIVEDDFLIAMQTEGALTEAGFIVVGIATTAEEAIALAKAQRPVLAVMDIRLASLRDGIDAAKELFAELNIRCIFATAHDDPHTRKRAEPYAPLGWLAKPYTMASLVGLIIAARSSLD
ncbi:MAG: two-component system, response regulator PdtaR [Bradyrhizobium sp.]|jgi:DNA-binding NarL/FixJ family response regulator|nr:two-component system, response regulator PdtaR [Bradyrhizobium sp.]